MFLKFLLIVDKYVGFIFRVFYRFKIIMLV